MLLRPSLIHPILLVAVLVGTGRSLPQAIAEGPAKLLVITHSGFNSLIDHSAEIKTAVMAALVARVRRTEPTAL